MDTASTGTTRATVRMTVGSVVNAAGSTVWPKKKAPPSRQPGSRPIRRIRTSTALAADISFCNATQHIFCSRGGKFECNTCIRMVYHWLQVEDSETEAGSDSRVVWSSIWWCTARNKRCCNLWRIWWPFSLRIRFKKEPEAQECEYSDRSMTGASGYLAKGSSDHGLRADVEALAD